MKKIAFFISFVFLSFESIGQNSGDNLFDNTVLHEIRFEFSEPNYLQILEANYENNFDPMDDKPYLMAKVTIDGEFVDSVGVRFKGFTSYVFYSDKKPVKIDFNEFVPGKRYDGLRKLNLNNSAYDASMQRDPVCYDLMRSIGVNAPRTSYSKVFFNDQYWGLYQNVEQVDKEFLQNNFNNPNGNLFKNLGWSKFEWNGPNAQEYKEIFELKTNRSGDDWSGFINLMDVLNNTTDEEFEDTIEDVFNVDLFLKTLLVDVATNNWDSYLEHGRNWYIYEDTATGVFHWIPWDYNLAFPNFSGGEPIECEVFPYFIPLTDGTSTVKFYDDSFGNISDYAWDFGDGNTSTERNPEHSFASIGLYNVCLTVFDGPDCSEVFCNTVSTFDNLYACNSILDGSCPHPVGKNFATVINFNSFCCDVWGEDCEELYDIISNGGGGGIGNFKLDQRNNEGVLISRLLNQERYFERYLDFACDLMQNHYTMEKYDSFIENNKNLIEEAVSTDPNLLVTLEEFLLDIGEDGIKKVISDRIDSLHVDLADHTECSAAPNIAFQDVVINEFVASNDSTSTIVDQDGEFDDWIELYNNTDSEIDLSDAFLSDNPENLLKWQFPIGTTIPADGYLIIWADEDQEQSGLHCNFKLSKAGEEIYLSNLDTTNIDQIIYLEQTTNVAFARIPNGTGDFTMTDATFNANNDGDPSNTIEPENVISMKVYPNPVGEELFIEVSDVELGAYNIDIISATGERVLSDIHNNPMKMRINIQELPSGYYFIQLTDKEGNRGVSKFAKMH